MSRATATRFATAVLLTVAACHRSRDGMRSGAPTATPPDGPGPSAGRDSAFGPSFEVDSTGRMRPIDGSHATATLDCAPHDGPAIRLRIPIPPREVLDAALWGAALDRMSGGRAVIALDRVAASSGTGSASVCPAAGGTVADPCRPISARIELDASGTREGDTLRGRAVVREPSGPERSMSFEARIARPAGGGPRCG